MDDGSHKPSRVEPPVVAMKKSIPGKTSKEAVSEKSGSSSGDNRFWGLPKGRFGAYDPLGEKFVLGWTQWAYILNCRKAEKLIPAHLCFNKLFLSEKAKGDDSHAE